MNLKKLNRTLEDIEMILNENAYMTKVHDEYVKLNKKIHEHLIRQGKLDRQLDKIKKLAKKYVIFELYINGQTIQIQEIKIEDIFKNMGH